MGPLAVVRVDPINNDLKRVVTVPEPMQPDALGFETPEKSFDHAVLLWTVRCDVLLAELVAVNDSQAQAGDRQEALQFPECRDCAAILQVTQRRSWVQWAREAGLTNLDLQRYARGI